VEKLRWQDDFGGGRREEDDFNAGEKRMRSPAAQMNRVY
jgi:hypothetical protein